MRVIASAARLPQHRVVLRRDRRRAAGRHHQHRAPTVSGEPQVGTRPSPRTPGSWTPGPVTPSYQWLADGAPLDGQTGRVHSTSAPPWSARRSRSRSPPRRPATPRSRRLGRDRPGRARATCRATDPPAVAGDARPGYHPARRRGQRSAPRGPRSVRWSRDYVLVPGSTARRTGSPPPTSATGSVPSSISSAPATSSWSCRRRSPRSVRSDAGRSGSRPCAGHPADGPQGHRPRRRAAGLRRHPPGAHPRQGAPQRGGPARRGEGDPDAAAAAAPGPTASGCRGPASPSAPSRRAA